MVERKAACVSVSSKYGATALSTLIFSLQELAQAQSYHHYS
jgi:hypothetical protein